MTAARLRGSSSKYFLPELLSGPDANVALPFPVGEMKRLVLKTGTVVIMPLFAGACKRPAELSHVQRAGMALPNRFRILSHCATMSFLPVLKAWLHEVASPKGRC